jgi:hypothetical protein
MMALEHLSYVPGRGGKEITAKPGQRGARIVKDLQKALVMAACHSLDMEYDEKMEDLAKKMYQAHNLPISWDAIEEEQLDPQAEKELHDAINRPRRVRGGKFCFRSHFLSVPP